MNELKEITKDYDNLLNESMQGNFNNLSKMFNILFTQDYLINSNSCIIHLDNIKYDFILINEQKEKYRIKKNKLLKNLLLMKLKKGIDNLKHIDHIIINISKSGTSEINILYTDNQNEKKKIETSF